MDRRRLNYYNDHKTRGRMNPLFRVPLILLTLILQFCRVANGYCPEAVKSMVKVGSCPTNNQEWETAAKLKNCRITAAEQKCSDADIFVYHCLIDGFENETLEVCAPQKLITGLCTEFNVDGGVIQIHRPTPCGKERFPSCSETYKSSEVYKYQGCYELVYGKKGINSTSIPTNKPSTSYKPENDATSTIIGVVVAIALVVCITIAAIYTYIKKKQQTRKSKDTSVDKEEQDSLIQKPVDNEQGPLRENTAMDDVKERRRPNLKDPFTGADKYTFAMVRTVHDLREENEDESKRYLKYYQTIDDYFCETERYEKAETVFKKNGIVVFTGLPGCGKTIAAIHLIRKELRDWTFRKLYSWEELHLIDDKKKTLLFIDNIFFRRTIELQLEKWWEKLDNIYDEYFASNYDECCFERLRIVMTARPNVIEKACAYMGKTTPILNEKYLIDVSKLTAGEKDNILDKQVQFARKEKKNSVPKIDAEFTRNVRESEGPIGYPLCAHLFVCSEEYQKSGTIFFSRPIEYLKLQIHDEMQTDQSKSTKTLFLFLFFSEWHSKMGVSEKMEITNAKKCKELLNKVSKDLLSNFTPCDFRNLEREAQRLLGTFIKEVGEHSYKFVHDSIYEAVGAYFCEKYVIKTAMYFPLDIIQIQEYGILTEIQMTTLATRLLYEILAQQLSTVFSCKILQNKKFVKRFCSEIEKKEGKTIEHIFTIANETSTVKLPCIFWSSCGNLIYLTERFYDIVRKRKINTDYQLYASLYGICCARSKGLLKTTNGILLDNFELIKGRVLSYLDSDGNSILHLIITSNYSDEFASFAVEEIVKNGVSIDSTNKHRISPLMIAVEQRLPRTKVIETIVKLSPKLRTRDSQYSTVFHHCLRSDHDDEMCAEYLKIIMHGKSAKDALSKDDIKGDTALSIAAKETNRSRIRSILVLLEANADIINTVNEDGYSPLHLCVRSLKAESAYMELECCIRVITLILYGADPEKLSDKDEKPIDECENDLVKDILRNPHDEKKIENSLKSIQNHFDLKEEDSMERTEELWDSSKIKSTSLRLCISRSAHFLKNHLIKRQCQ